MKVDRAGFGQASRARLHKLAKIFAGKVVLFAPFAHVEGFLGTFIPEFVAALVSLNSVSLEAPEMQRSPDGLPFRFCILAERN